MVAELVQQFVNGVVFGAILALAAIGLSLVYGILRLSNFAHGDFVTLGAFLTLLFAVELLPNLFPWSAAIALALLATAALDAAWTRRLERGERVGIAAVGGLLGAFGLWNRLTDPEPSGTTNLILATATLLSMVASVVFLFALEFLLWRPLRRRKATILSFIIVSIGVSLVVRNALLLHFGGGNRFFSRPTPESDLFLGVRISNAQQLALLLALLIIGCVHVFLKYTRAGKAMRALADNVDLARATGINVDRMILYVWAIAGSLTALSGVLLTLVLNNNMTVNMGFNLLLPLFAAVILGGIGSPYGAIAGGFLVGVAMKTSVLWIGAEYELATAFVLLILVILVRPAGVFGSRA